MLARKAVLKLAGLTTLAAVGLGGCGGGSTPPPPIMVSVSASAQSVDQGQGVTVTATIGNDTSGKGVTWSVSCSGASCGSVSNPSGNTVSYTAPNPVSASLMVTLTATSVADATKSASATVTVTSPPSVTTSKLPGATGGTAYSASLQETGGVAPYTWGLTGTNGLPAGLDLGTDGTISGTPTQGENSQFTVQVADSGSPPLTASANLAINVTVIPLSVSTTSLPDASLDSDYTQSLQASGGIPPYTWTISGGSLPAWATLQSSGAVEGIPGVTGTANFTVQVADSQSTPLTSTQPLSIHVKTSASANDSELNGQYAFLFSGWDDVTSKQEAVIGSIVADGSGTISSGIQDENGPNGTNLSVAITGTYYIGANNRGAITLTTSAGSRTYAVTLSSVNSGVAQRARFIEYDDTNGTSGQRGSGVMRLQDASAFALAKISGPYAFGFAGQDANANAQAIAGAITTDGAGTISSGIADQNVAGTATNPPLSGSYPAPSPATGRTTMKMIPSTSAALNLAVYVVSATEFFAMQTDAFSTAGVVSGSILAQNSMSFAAGSLNVPSVYYQIENGISSFEVGLLAPDGNGNLSAVYDSQNGATIVKGLSFAATYTVASGGRVTISNWYSDSSSPLRVVYLVDTNKGFFLNTDPSVGSGFVEPQTVPAGGFTNASLSGTFSAVTLTPQNATNMNEAGAATLDGSSAFSETADLSKSTGLFLNQTISGTYSVGGNGRGVVSKITASASTIAGVLLTLGVAAIVIGAAGRRKHTTRSGIALFSLALFFATTPASCPTLTNLVAIYVLSPQKAIILHQLSITPGPTISILEQ